MSKSKGKGVSASSFFDLKAELSKQEQEFAKNKAAGKNYIVGGVKRPDKKPTVWARQNKGLQGRASRDVELEAVSRPTLESARAALERKAKIYEKLRKGKTGGLNDKQYDALLVDFELKPIDGSYESDSDDVDESIEIARPPNDEDDPLVEYEDEFGRIRTARQSEVPRNFASQFEEQRNPVNHFPVYEPSAERVAEIAAAHAEENNPLGVHYDASKEVRAKGAGFYQFSADEETRQAQMEELKSAREETGRVRQETGATDVRPGEVEGMRGPSDSTTTSASRAMDKRKREIEERRKLIDAKRRKLAGGLGETLVPTSVLEPPPLEPPRTVTTPALDPFAVLEATSSSKRTKTQPVAQAPPANEADTFLAQLEKEFTGTKKK
ncbi:hypothetical protein BDZ94DRAFT_1280013 [Collybia nuda]|uniref:Coiled-coil domain-containing protein 174 n=1 Tax=Collybia nuda TaxID=64659 RepID=A0A9P5YFX4_9AGAR|nr:hypothetical protein BDZ94DRAFT_1280013 [Collybia nuda]